MDTSYCGCLINSNGPSNHIHFDHILSIWTVTENKTLVNCFTIAYLSNENLVCEREISVLWLLQSSLFYVLVGTRAEQSERGTCIYLSRKYPFSGIFSYSYVYRKPNITGKSTGALLSQLKTWMISQWFHMACTGYNLQ